MKIKSARRGSTYQCLIIQKNVYVSLNYFLFYLYACYRATSDRLSRSVISDNR